MVLAQGLAEDRPLVGIEPAGGLVRVVGDGRCRHHRMRMAAAGTTRTPVGDDPIRIGAGPTVVTQHRFPIPQGAVRPVDIGHDVKDLDSNQQAFPARGRQVGATGEAGARGDRRGRGRRGIEVEADTGIDIGADQQAGQDETGKGGGRRHGRRR